MKRTNQRMYAAFGTYYVVSGPMVFVWLELGKGWSYSAILSDGHAAESIKNFAVLIGTNVVMRNQHENQNKVSNVRKDVRCW